MCDVRGCGDIERERERERERESGGFRSCCRISSVLCAFDLSELLGM